MSAQPDNSTKLVTIGVLSGVHGIRGQLKVKSFTDPHSAFTTYKKLYWNYSGNWELMPVEPNSVLKQGNNILLKIQNCQDRDLAKAYVSTEIAIDRQELPTLAAGQYYWADLEGLDVYNTEKVYLGVVDYLIETGSNDVLVVKANTKEHLIPYIRDTYILEIDLQQNQMIVDWDPEF